MTLTPSRPVVTAPAHPQPSGPGPRPGGAVLWLSVTSAALALTAALVGLLAGDLYDGPTSLVSMLRGWDLVTATVAVPLLLATLWRSWRTGSRRAQLVWVGVLAYVPYTYAYYVFGTGFHDLFLLHVAVLAASLTALVAALADLHPDGLATAVRPATRVRTVSVVLAVLALSLTGMWVVWTLHNAVTGEVPPGSALVETDTVVHLGIALDLALLVPLYASSAMLLWQRRDWGFALAAVALVAGVLHQVSYLVALPFQVAADVPDAVPFDPFEPVIVGLYLLGTLLLLRGTPGASGVPGHHP